MAISIFLFVLDFAIVLTKCSAQQMPYRVISGNTAQSSRIATTLTCDQERSNIQICAEECFQMTENGTGCPGFHAHKNGSGPCYICQVSNVSQVETDAYTTFTNNHFLYLRTHNKIEPEVAMDFEDFSPESNNIHGNNVDGTTNGITISDHVTGIKGKGISLNNGAKIILSGFGHECWTNIEHCTNGLTLSIWVKLKHVTPAYVVGSGAIFQRGVNIWLQNHFSMMTTLDDRRFYAWSTTVPVVNTWYLITGTYHPTDGDSVYLNGILEAENRFDSIGYHTVSQEDWRATIGARDSVPATDPFTGTVDEFKYYYRIINAIGAYLKVDIYILVR